MEGKGVGFTPPPLEETSLPSRPGAMTPYWPSPGTRRLEKAPAASHSFAEFTVSLFASLRAIR